jgi:hypothetical protein
MDGSVVGDRSVEDLKAFIRGIYLVDVFLVYPNFWTSQALPYFQDGTQLTIDSIVSVATIKFSYSSWTNDSGMQ